MHVRTRALYSWKLPKLPETKDFQRRTRGRQKHRIALFSHGHSIVAGPRCFRCHPASFPEAKRSRYRANSADERFAPLGYSISKWFDVQSVGALSFG